MDISGGGPCPDIWKVSFCFFFLFIFFFFFLYYSSFFFYSWHALGPLQRRGPWTSSTQSLRHWSEMKFNTGGVTGIFFWGGKVVFPDFFSPAWNALSWEKIPILVDPKQISVILKSKRKKKELFLLPFSTLPFSDFPFLMLPFSLFSLPLFSWYISRNFPVRSLWGALSPTPPPCYTTGSSMHDGARSSAILCTNALWDLRYSPFRNYC